MYLHQTPRLIRALGTDFFWRIPTENKEVFLTFDDGPTPIITEKVLDLLSHYQAKATFFCIGKNVDNHPQLFHRILDEGHEVGNHTQNHKNGWKTGYAQYLRDVLTAKKSNPSTLFRPPYGQISRTQTKALLKHYSIIMWDVLTGDFDASLSVETCIEKVLQLTKPGSIIVFHDSLKASPIMLQTLPAVLEALSQKGYQFSSIQPHHVRRS
jgi:peptidoglycan/xylan/chitin deacetylase (PgdA/CDA1 family)